MILALIVNAIGFLHLLTQTFYQLHKEKVIVSVNEALLLRWIFLILLILVDNVLLGLAEVLPFGVYVYNYYKLMVFLSKSEFHVRMLQKFIVKADPDVLGEFILGLIARIMIRIMHKACMMLKRMSLPVSQADYNLSMEIMQFLEEYHPKIIKTSSNANNTSIIDASTLDITQEEIAAMRRREALRRVREEEKELKRKQIEEEIRQQEEQIKIQAEFLAKRKQDQLEAINQQYKDEDINMDEYSFQEHKNNVLSRVDDQQNQQIENILSLLDDNFPASNSNSSNNQNHQDCLINQKQNNYKEGYQTNQAQTQATVPADINTHFADISVIEYIQNDANKAKINAQNLEIQLATTMPSFSQNNNQSKVYTLLSSEKNISAKPTSYSNQLEAAKPTKKIASVTINNSISVDAAVAAARLRMAQQLNKSKQTSSERTSSYGAAVNTSNSRKTSASLSQNDQLNDAKTKFEQYKKKYSTSSPTSFFSSSGNDSVSASTQANLFNQNDYPLSYYTAAAAHSQEDFENVSSK